MSEETQRSAHRGTFIGGHLYDEEIEKFEQIVKALANVTGEENRSATLRYIIRHFDLESSPLGKEAAPVALAA